MLLSIKEMEVRKLPFAQTWQPGEIDFSDALAVQTAPLTAEGVAELLPHTGGEVRVKGRVQTTLDVECDRCLTHAPIPVDLNFDLFYRPAESAPKDEEEVSIDEGEAEMGFYEMPGLVLEEVLHEQIVLGLPMQRVCSESCKGICPECGANRNEKQCSCEVHPADDRWNALKSLHLESRQ